MKHFFSLATVLLLVIGSSNMVAQGSKAAKSAGGPKAELRVAVVDVEKIAKELPEAIEADRKLTELKNKYLDSMKTIEATFKAKFDLYQKNKAMMTADAQKKEEDELTNLRNMYTAFQEDNFGNQGTLVRKRNELLQPILQKIQDAIQQVAKEDQFSMVFDKGATAVLVYADEKFDITHKIIDRMKRGK